MRSRFLLLTLGLYLTFAIVGCNKSATDNNTNNDTATSDNQSAPSTAPGSEKAAKPREHKEVKREPIVVPAGTAVTVSLGSTLGSKVSQPGQTFSGTVSKDVMAGTTVAIHQGSAVSGTVTDAKPLGRFAGGAVLVIRLDSITAGGAELRADAAPLTFSAKGKGKRTAVLAGGGAALGGIVGALAGGGKGAAIGAAAGAGAGTGGAAFTGNKDIVLAAESNVTFELSQPLDVRK
jgi:hypothetical protein